MATSAVYQPYLVRYPYGQKKYSGGSYKASVTATPMVKVGPLELFGDFWGGLAIGTIIIGPIVWTLAGRAFAKAAVGKVTSLISR